MRKILDQKFWSHGTPLGYLGAHLAPYSGVRKFLFGDFKHLWDGLHYHASHCSGEFHDSQWCFGSYVGLLKIYTPIAALIQKLDGVTV